MAGSTLAALAAAGVIERRVGRKALRISARFMAHLEANRHELAVRGVQHRTRALEQALASWHSYRGDPLLAVDILDDWLAEQMVQIQPVPTVGTILATA